jgi:hypothetical protein
MKPTLVQAIQSLSPDSQFALDGLTLAGLRWISGNRPTNEQIEQELVRLQQAYDAAEYQRLRAAEYPPLDLLLVALWESAIENRPATAADLQAAREAIKQKYPKPQVVS